MINIVNLVFVFHTVLCSNYGKRFSIFNDESRMFSEEVNRKVTNSGVCHNQEKIPREKFELTLFHSELASLVKFLNITDILYKGNTTFKPIVDMKSIRDESGSVHELLKGKNEKLTLAELCKREMSNCTNDQNLLSLETIFGLGLNCFKKINEDLSSFPKIIFIITGKWRNAEFCE